MENTTKISSQHLGKNASYLLTEFWDKKQNKHVDILLTGKITEVLINIKAGAYGYRVKFNNSPSLCFNAVQFIDISISEELKNYIGENLNKLTIEY